MFKVFLNKCQSDIWYLGSTLLVYNINQPLLKRFLYLEDRPADALVCKWPIQLTSTNSPNYISLNHHFARAPPCSPSLLEWWGPVSKIPHSTSRSSSSTATLTLPTCQFQGWWGALDMTWHRASNGIEVSTKFCNMALINWDYIGAQNQSQLPPSFVGFKERFHLEGSGWMCNWIWGDETYAEL